MDTTTDKEPGHEGDMRADDARDHTALTQWPNDQLPTCDGMLDIELSNRPIPYHVSYCYRCKPSGKACHDLSMHACRVATMSMDVIRGRIPPQNLELYLTGPCVHKLETMAYLLGNHLRTHPKLREELCFLPAVPTMANGMMVSPTNLEMVVGVKIGTTQYWSSLVFKVNGRRWVCTLSDIG